MKTKCHLNNETKIFYLIDELYKAQRDLMVQTICRVIVWRENTTGLKSTEKAG